jgi:hypothetical protein
LILCQTANHEREAEFRAPSIYIGPGAPANHICGKGSALPETILPSPSRAVEFILSSPTREERLMRWQWPKDETHRLILAAIVLIGIGALIFDPMVFPSSWDNAILSEPGKAFIIVGILGFTIEPWLRRAFARDVFRLRLAITCPMTLSKK